MRFLLFALFILNGSFLYSFNLITTFYNEANVDRQQEYFKCLENNIKNSYIKQIYIFYEGLPKNPHKIFLNQKIKLMPILDRPSFRQFFSFANNSLANTNVIIANTDIYFDDTLGLLEGYDFKKNLLCLTRYNVYETGWKRHIESHDAWIFSSPLSIDIPDDVKIGFGACDIILQRIASSMPEIEVLNPSLDIKTWHLHKSDKRNYQGSCNHHYQKYRPIAVPFSYLYRNKYKILIVWSLIFLILALIYGLVCSKNKKLISRKKLD